MIARSELKLVFTGLLTQYAGAGRVFDSYWKEIVEAYEASERRYHNLHHLLYIYRKLEECPQKPDNRESVLFALFYHDLVYEIPNVDNEKKSAAVAEQRMRGLGVEKHTIDLAKKHILATKEHLESGDADTNLFCDADMAILGDTAGAYDEYCGKVRIEYSVVSDEDFARGRARELNKLLEMPRLFKTEYFFARYEARARLNMNAEKERLLHRM